MKVFAGIVLYEPETKRLEKNIQSILPQVEQLILIDNASDNYLKIREKYKDISKIVFIRNEKNHGIGTALNQIAKSAMADGADWVLTLDQDSVCESMLIEKNMLYIENNQEQAKRIGILSPRIVDKNLSEEPYDAKKETEKLEFCITSGSFINLEIYHEVGGFNEEFFIDWVDFEYCKRVREKGYDIIRLNQCVISHQLGNSCEKKILGKRVIVTNHSSLRDYYYARNAINFLKMYDEKTDRKFVRRKLISKSLKILFFEKKKIEKLRAIRSGMKDAHRVEKLQ